jgi:hypothetical protein
LLEVALANKSQSGTGYVDASIASLSGSSQQLLAQQPTRGALIIQNVGANNIGIRFVPLAEPDAAGNVTLPAAAAAIGSAGTLTLFPGDSYEPTGGSIPINAINIIGTSTQPVTCYYTV